ncbi:MAG: N-acetylmuramoyl-L-alanine amidase, partial [Helicobacter sp.]|nr:N-acetylmuramoyl-L-alanine amidase [Helicobacter sp.]
LTNEQQQSEKSDIPKNNKVIVIDPGHGGKDCGAISIANVCEKEIVLKTAKYLDKELKDRGYKVYMTRSEDVFVGLRERTKFANSKNADLFISIHANAVLDNKAKSEGIESYFLSIARSERAKNVAALENKDNIEVMNYFSKQSFLNTLNTQRIVASNRLAIDIQFGMLQSVRTKYNVLDGGVREGPFWVLVGALMPSVLLEIGYLTHPKEGYDLNQEAYQKSIAIGIADGIDGYFAKNP